MAILWQLLWCYCRQCATTTTSHHLARLLTCLLLYIKKEKKLNTHWTSSSARPFVNLRKFAKPRRCYYDVNKQEERIFSKFSGPSFFVNIVYHKYHVQCSKSNYKSSYLPFAVNEGWHPFSRIIFQGQLFAFVLFGPILLFVKPDYGFTKQKYKRSNACF